MTAKYPTKCDFVRPYLGTRFLASRQCHSIRLVCAPVSGSTKLTLWLTFKCVYPSDARQSYAFQQSLIMPGSIYSLMTDRRVADVLSSTGIIKKSRDSLQIPPNTHCPSTTRPTLYFLFPNLDSSISTILPSPPIFLGRDTTWFTQTSRAKEDQSFMVFFYTGPTHTTQTYN